jgi:N-acetylglucosaminyldiphosphoundecaprenol N-acetyl-beta-D-mannosaminyltransferase
MQYSISGITINFDKESIINQIIEATKSHDNGYICTVNANLIAEAYVNPDYASILNNSMLNICDGSLIATAINWIYKTSITSWAGPDFFIDIIKNSPCHFKHYFLGSTDEKLSYLKKNVTQLNPSISTSIFKSLPFRNVDNFDYKEISTNINKISPDIIWVSLGAPKQEYFASKLMPHLTNGIVICVGAAFDFYSDLNGSSRAPKFIRRSKLEWAWRLIKSPSKTARRLWREVLILPPLILSEQRKQQKFTRI